MQYKPLAEVRYLVVHRSATPPDKDIGAKEIDLEHRQRGSFAIGYHYVVRRNGRVEDGRPLDQPGAHVPRFNQCSIGICLVGGCNADTEEENNFTPEQRVALLALLVALRVKFPRAEILGHRDMPGATTSSPSFDVRAWFSAASGSAT
jgi:N-acetyl-anhydromuramyl-L-alanine amidase AmpD